MERFFYIPPSKFAGLECSCQSVLCEHEHEHELDSWRPCVLLLEILLFKKRNIIVQKCKIEILLFKKK